MEARLIRKRTINTLLRMRLKKIVSKILVPNQCKKYRIIAQQWTEIGKINKTHLIDFIFNHHTNSAGNIDSYNFIAIPPHLLSLIQSEAETNEYSNSKLVIIKNIPKFCNTISGNNFTKQQIKINDFEFRIHLYPNGLSKITNGFVQFFIELTKKPSNINGIVVYIELFCIETFTKCKQTKLFKEIGDSEGWIWLLTNKQCKNYNMLQFSAQINILQLQFNDNNKNIQDIMSLKNSLHIHQLMQYVWKCNEIADILNNIKRCNHNTLSLSENTFDNMFCFGIESTKCYKKKINISILCYLLKLPLNTKEIIILFKVKMGHPEYRNTFKVSYHSSVCRIKLLRMDTKWLLNLLQSNRIDFAFVLSVEIKEIYRKSTNGQQKKQNNNNTTWLTEEIPQNIDEAQNDNNHRNNNNSSDNVAPDEQTTQYLGHFNHTIKKLNNIEQVEQTQYFSQLNHMMNKLEGLSPVYGNIDCQVSIVKNDFELFHLRAERVFFVQLIVDQYSILIREPYHISPTKQPIKSSKQRQAEQIFLQKIDILYKNNVMFINKSIKQCIRTTKQTFELKLLYLSIIKLSEHPLHHLYLILSQLKSQFEDIIASANSLYYINPSNYMLILWKTKCIYDTEELLEANAVLQESLNAGKLQLKLINKKKQYLLCYIQCIEQCEQLKKIGNEYYKVKDMESAMNKYNEAIQIMDRAQINRFDVDDGYYLKKKVNQLEIALNNNISIILLKTKKYKLAVNYAAKVLTIDAQNIKALFRRCVSLLYLNKLELARKDFETLKLIDNACLVLKQINIIINDNNIDFHCQNQ